MTDRSLLSTSPEPLIGERSVPLVTRVLSRQARVTHWVATGLMLLLGIGVLGWYYGRQVHRQARLRQLRVTATSALAATEMVLPPLGNIHASTQRRPNDPPSPISDTPAAFLLATPLTVTPEVAARAASQNAADGRPDTDGPGQRRLQGDVYAGIPGPTLRSTPVTAMPASGATDEVTSSPLAGTVTPGATPSSLPGQLAPADSPPVAAHRLGDRSLLLSKGTFIDCTLETAIDSTLPGLTSCVTASDTFGANGEVPLLERGTRLFGETQGQVQQGSARVYVLWTEARTPAGVVVPLESPGTDELGRSGLPGSVQRHFWERFGAAMLLSTIDGAVQAAVQASSRDGGTVIYNPGATQDVMTEVLKSTVSIPPTVIKRNGDRIEVMVAHDVDFAGVYALQKMQAGR